MTIEQSFFVDILNLMPINSICYIQAPNLDLNDLLKSTVNDYYRSIELNDVNKKIFIDKILAENINEEIQSLEIKFNNKLLFEGYDGVEYGIISKTIELSELFIHKYQKNELFMISVDW